MKNIIVALCLLCSHICLSQNCKYQFDKVDDFSKKRSVCTKFERIYSKGKGGRIAALVVSSASSYNVSGVQNDIFFCACNMEGKNLLRIKYRSTSYGAGANYQQNYLILLENGDIVTAKIIDQGTTGGYGNYGVDGSEASYFLGVDSLSWSKLKASPVKKIRIPKDEYNYSDWEIKPQDGDVIQNSIVCIDALNIPATFESSEVKQKESNPTTQDNQINTQLPGLIKKWVYKGSYVDSKGVTTEIVQNTEYFADGRFETLDLQDNKTYRGTYIIANGGKILVSKFPGNVTSTVEIVSIDDHTFVMKGSDGKLYVCTAQ